MRDCVTIHNQLISYKQLEAEKRDEFEENSNE